MRAPLRRLGLLLLGLLLAACRRPPDPNAPLRLGFFPNVTHAQAMVGATGGDFARAMGGRRLELKPFNAGPAAMEALLAGAVDVSYVGSGPALTAYVRSHGAIKVIAGAASGGSVLVARTARSAKDLSGKRVATPQLGNSQDIALRSWLRAQGLAPLSLGGTVSVLPQSNPEIMALFQRGEIEAAWVPEPWGARLVEAGGHILVDERDLWPGGRFPTTVLVATEEALRTHREDVKAVLRAHLELTERARRDTLAFAEQTNRAFARLAGKPMSEKVLRQSFSRLELLVDPMGPQLREVARHAEDIGYLPRGVDLSGLVDTTLLDELRREGVGGSGR